MPVTETASQDMVADVKPTLEAVTLVGSGIEITEIVIVSEIAVQPLFVTTTK